MTDKLFDSFIKQKLGNYESKVPEGLWEKIEQEQERKKRPVAFWWNKNTVTLGILIIISIAGLGLWLYNHKNNDQQIANNSAKQKLQNRTESNKKNDIATNTETFSDNKMSEDTELQNDNEFKNKIDKGNKKTKETKETNNGNIIGKNSDNITTYSKLKGKTVTNENKGTDRRSIQNLNDENLNNQDNDFINNYDVLQSKNKLAFINTKAKSFAGTTLLASNKSSSINKKTNSEVKNIFSKYENQAYDIVTNTFNIQKTANNNLKNINLGNLFGRGDECPSARGAVRNDLYLETYFSPDYTFKKTIISKGGMDAYLNKKDSVEMVSGGFTVGARISKNITSNLLLKAGLQYSQINEKFSLKTENEKRQTIVINTHSIIRPGQSDTTVSDTSVRVEVGYRVQSNMNYYKNFELPIYASYEFDTWSKWKFAVNGGVILNLASWYEGRTIDMNNNLISINNKNGNAYYKQKLGLGLYASVSIIRAINDKMDFFAEPYYRFSINKIEANDGFNKRFNAIGLQLGIRMKLNKTLGF